MLPLNLPLYVSRTTMEERQQQCARITAKHGADMIPIVLQAVGKYAKVNFTALPATATVAELQAVVREVGDVSKRTACALQVAGCSPATTTSLWDLQAHCASEDGFLYVCYMGESAMGASCMGSGGSGGATDGPTSHGSPHPAMGEAVAATKYAETPDEEQGGVSTDLDWKQSPPAGVVPGDSHFLPNKVG